VRLVEEEKLRSDQTAMSRRRIGLSLFPLSRLTLCTSLSSPRCFYFLFCAAIRGRNLQNFSSGFRGRWRSPFSEMLPPFFSDGHKNSLSPREKDGFDIPFPVRMSSFFPFLFCRATPPLSALNVFANAAKGTRREWTFLPLLMTLFFCVNFPFTSPPPSGRPWEFPYPIRRGKIIYRSGSIGQAGFFRPRSRLTSFFCTGRHETNPHRHTFPCASSFPPPRDMYARFHVLPFLSRLLLSFSCLVLVLPTVAKMKTKTPRSSTARQISPFRSCDPPLLFPSARLSPPLSTTKKRVRPEETEPPPPLRSGWAAGLFFFPFLYPPLLFLLGYMGFPPPEMKKELLEYGAPDQLLPPQNWRVGIFPPSPRKTDPPFLFPGRQLETVSSPLASIYLF